MKNELLQAEMKKLKEDYKEVRNLILLAETLKLEGVTYKAFTEEAYINIFNRLGGIFKCPYYFA